MLRGGIADRGGVRVGHRIIEINNQSVVAVSHDKIVHLLATSVGQVRKCSSKFLGLRLIVRLNFHFSDSNENYARGFI